MAPRKATLNVDGVTETFLAVASLKHDTIPRNITSRRLFSLEDTLLRTNGVTNQLGALGHIKTGALRPKPLKGQLITQL